MINRIKQYLKRFRRSKAPSPITDTNQTNNKLLQCLSIYTHITEHVDTYSSDLQIQIKAPQPKSVLLIKQLHTITDKIRGRRELLSSDVSAEPATLIADEFYRTEDGRYVSSHTHLNNICYAVEALIKELVEISVAQYGVDEHNFRLTKGMVIYLIELGESITHSGTPT